VCPVAASALRFIERTVGTGKHCCRSSVVGLLALHDTYRAEIEGALAELVREPREAAALADGLLSLLDGNLLLGIFGAPGRGAERRQGGLRAIAEAILRDLPER
jgi:hypothetical protein